MSASHYCPESPCDSLENESIDLSDKLYTSLTAGSAANQNLTNQQLRIDYMSQMNWTELDNRAVDTARVLAADAVE